MGHPLDPNKAATRFRGPLLVGAPAEMSMAAVNGESTEPLVSFYNAPEFGYYAVSSAQVRFAAVGMVCAITSGAMRVGTTAFYAATGGQPHLVIPVSTATLSSGTLPLSADIQGGAALVYMMSSDGAATGKIWVYTTASTGWMASTGLFTTTST